METGKMGSSQEMVLTLDKKSQWSTLAAQKQKIFHPKINNKGSHYAFLVLLMTSCMLLVVWRREKQ